MNGTHVRIKRLHSEKNTKLQIKKLAWPRLPQNMVLKNLSKILIEGDTEEDYDQLPGTAYMFLWILFKNCLLWI